MQRNSTAKLKVALKTKITLIIFGLFLFFILLEVGLRLGGFVLLSMQEYSNRQAIKQKGAYRIMCLGESTTAFGGQNSWPVQLEEILNQRNIGINFSVINKGTPSINTTYILSELESNLLQYKPCLVIAMIGINDFGVLEHIYYPNIPRVYKLVNILFLRILSRTKDIKIPQPKEGNKPDIDYVGLAQKDVWRLIELGDQKRNMGNYAQAEAIFKRVAEFDIDQSTRSVLTYKLGESYIDQGNYAQAEIAFKKAIELNPKNSPACIALAFCFREQRNDAQAQNFFERALDLTTELHSDSSTQPYIELGRFCFDKEDYAQAEQFFKKAIELKASSGWSYFRLGEVYMKQNNYAQAEIAFKKEIELNPKNEKAYGGLLTLYNASNKEEDRKYYMKKLNELLLRYQKSITVYNYQQIKKILDGKNIKLACVQYPMRNIEPLKLMFRNQGENIVFIDNQKVFQKAVKKSGYKEYFTDMFAGDFGHCTEKGNRLLAENIANVIIKEVFSR